MTFGGKSARSCQDRIRATKAPLRFRPQRGVSFLRRSLRLWAESKRVHGWAATHMTRQRRTSKQVPRGRAATVAACADDLGRTHWQAGCITACRPFQRRGTTQRVRSVKAVQCHPHPPSRCSPAPSPQDTTCQRSSNATLRVGSPPSAPSSRSHGRSGSER